MTSALAWAKKWWRWVLIGLACAVAFLLGLELKKPKITITPVPGPSPEQQGADTRAKDAEAKAQAAHDAAVEDVSRQHARELADLIKIVTKDTEADVGSVDATNRDLLDIGRQVRKN